MTRQTQSKKKLRTQHSPSFQDEALGLAEKKGEWHRGNAVPIWIR